MGKHFGEAIIEKVIEMKKSGKSNVEIREFYNLSKKQLENLLTRHRIKEEKLSQGIAPKPKGRPRNRNLTQQQKLKLENQRLQTENKLLRSFLQAAGRM